MRLARWIVLMSVGSLVACAGMPLGGRERMLSVLHEGGYVIFFRHATTDWSQKDTDLSDLKNCAAQRNLADAGRAQARAIGEAFNRLGIPVGEILASPYCRTLETAQLGFGRVQATEDLRHINLDTAQARIDGLARLVNTAPAGGLNTVLISHHPNLEALTGVVLDEGEAAVFKPGGRGQYQLLYRVKARVWTELSAAHASETHLDLPPLKGTFHRFLVGSAGMAAATSLPAVMIAATTGSASRLHG